MCEHAQGTIILVCETSLVDIVCRGVVRRITADVLGVCGLVHPDVINEHRRRKLDIREIDAPKVDRKPEVGNDVLHRPSAWPISTSQKDG